MATIVPANGEVLIWIYPDYDVEDGEDPYFLNQCPIVAWRIVDAGEGMNEIWGEPVLPAHAEIPEVSSADIIKAYLLPSGKVYTSDGSEQFDSIGWFTTRWRQFYDVRIRDKNAPTTPDEKKDVP